MRRYNLEVWTLAQSRGDGHRSLVTSESVLSRAVVSRDTIFQSLGLLSTT